MDHHFCVSLEEIEGYFNNKELGKIIGSFETLMNDYQIQQARLEALLATVNEAICIIDEKDKVVAWNHCAQQLYGIATEDILHQPIEQFFSNLMLTKVMKERRTVNEEYHAPCPDAHVLINARPVKLAGQVIGGVCAERDITEIVQLHQKLSKTHEEVATLKLEIDKMHTQTDGFSGIYGHSTAIREAICIARRVAATNVPILLRGESGTGKELFAKAIHETSGLVGPFVAINCGAISPSLFESELFGYQPGAFTGADRKGKIGLLEQANGGTLLLDELGDMPKDMQVKLLRTLQDKSFYRVGGNKLIHIDVRIIAATHRNLEDMIIKGEFREDLYYRLNVVAISLPSLRDRLDDIPELVHKGIQYYGSIHNKKVAKVDPALMATLIQYPWPGNIRELFNVLERLVILADDSLLTIEQLPSNFRQSAFSTESLAGSVETRIRDVNLPEITVHLEKETIAKVLVAEHFNKAAAAKKLGVPRSTLYYKMQKLGIECQ